tara:strand:+ start:1686 stop:2240 length:555 start_codon:yes stop_codon:yes gene_type:complete
MSIFSKIFRKNKKNKLDKNITAKDKLHRMADELKEFLAENEDLSASFIYGDDNFGGSIIQGDSHVLHYVLFRALEKEPQTQKVFKNVVKQLDGEFISDKNDFKDNGPKIVDPTGVFEKYPDHIKKSIIDQIEKDGKNSPKIIDLPGGLKGLVTGKNQDASDLSDKDIDGFIDDIINGTFDSDES